MCRVIIAVQTCGDANKTIRQNMKLLGLLLLVGLAAGNPVSYRECHETQIFMKLGEDSFNETFKKYTSEHDIVNMLVPLNDLTYKDFSSPGRLNISVPLLFFVEGDYKDDGTFESKGLFVLKTETGEVTKLLDNGVDFAAAQDKTKDVYFAATDGIYVYNAEKNTAEKYGSVTDSIISIGKAKDRDVIYALTADKQLYKVTENGEKKVKVDEVKNAQQIVMGLTDKLYFYNDQKEVFSVDFENNVKKIEGFPENANKVTLLRPLLYINNNFSLTMMGDDFYESIPVMVDDNVDVIQPDGKISSRPNGSLKTEITVHPTAYALEALKFQYIAYNKTIYELSSSASVLLNNDATYSFRRISRHYDCDASN